MAIRPIGPVVAFRGVGTVQTNAFWKREFSKINLYDFTTFLRHLSKNSKEIYQSLLNHGISKDIHPHEVRTKHPLGKHFEASGNQKSTAKSALEEVLMYYELPSNTTAENFAKAILDDQNGASFT